jgi:hypothetical protein
MSTVAQAYETQIKNIQAKTGNSIAELEKFVANSGLNKHGELREMLMRELGLGHGDANALVHYILKSDGERAAQTSGASQEDVLAEIYSGSKAGLRPIHERLMAEILPFGEFEIAPKKGYVSLRRKKQFAMLGPATSTRVELGLNMKGVEPTARLLAQPAGGMCNYKVKLSSPEEVDAEVIAWIRQAFDASA